MQYTIIKPCNTRFNMGSTYVITCEPIRVYLTQALSLKFNDRAARLTNHVESLIQINRNVQADE